VCQLDVIHDLVLNPHERPDQIDLKLWSESSRSPGNTCGNYLSRCESRMQDYQYESFRYFVDLISFDLGVHRSGRKTTIHCLPQIIKMIHLQFETPSPPVETNSGSSRIGTSQHLNAAQNPFQIMIEVKK
jgi:hypothetical protein